VPVFLHPSRFAGQRAVSNADPVADGSVTHQNGFPLFANWLYGCVERED
jgi:hypothetical protein